MVKSRRFPRPLDPAPIRLTPREREVARWLGEDLTYEVLGERLEISEHGVRKHVRSLLRKLGVHSRHAAVASLAALGYPVITAATLDRLRGADKGTRRP
ncbi:MAG TPA: helix-turn-helix transcriptional regulator [Verrucomicrobiota bacterium]|nr:helix-turn-helix transcriptional regulator [Verrucomicrobiota bacterium]